VKGPEVSRAFTMCFLKQQDYDGHPHVAGQDAKGAKAYVMRSLLPPKARAIVKGPEVSQAFAMVVLALINLSPSKKLGKGKGCTIAHDGFQ
jgi:hypothetical protein